MERAKNRNVTNVLSNSKKLLFSSLLRNFEWRKPPFRSVEATFTLFSLFDM